MNANQELAKIEASLTRAIETIYLLQTNGRKRSSLRDAISTIEDALAKAKNLEDSIYSGDIND